MAIARVRAAITAPPALLFVCMFAAQGALLVLSPILPELAADLGVSTAVGAQLRSVSGLVAGAVALWLGVRSRPRPLRQVLGLGLILLAAATAASAAAPTFLVLATAQVAIGAALALVLSSGLAAAAEWAPDDIARTLSWALMGQPAAWIIGMPLVGVVAAVSWRYAWLALPFAASVLALGGLALRSPDSVPPARSEEPAMWREPGTVGWALGELLAYSGWAGTLVFAGALFIESYDASTTIAGFALACAAMAYLPGNLLARRRVGEHARSLLLFGAFASAAGVVLFGALRPGLLFSLAALAALAFVSGGRTIAGSSLGLALAPRCRLQAMSIRTAAVQYGYLFGAALGGTALAAGGYAALGLTLAALYLLAAMPHVAALVAARRHATVLSSSTKPGPVR